MQCLKWVSYSYLLVALGCERATSVQIVSLGQAGQCSGLREAADQSMWCQVVVPQVQKTMGRAPSRSQQQMFRFTVSTLRFQVAFCVAVLQAQEKMDEAGALKIAGDRGKPVAWDGSALQVNSAPARSQSTTHV